MKKKEKKLKKKLKQGKEKLKRANAVADDSVIHTLTNKIKKLKAELKNRDDIIFGLQKRLKKSEGKSEKSDKKNGQLKAKGSTAKILRTQQSARIGIVQKEAWKKHGFLRDRYEYHLENGQDKEAARVLADKDLRDAFGDEAGYSKQDLEDILS
jgi:predicted RNase H-like nuclease (RuvC/YqgF family)